MSPYAVFKNESKLVIIWNCVEISMTKWPHSRPVAFWSLSASEQLQGPHHQRHIRCLSGVWSGTRASVQLSKPSDATYSTRPVGQPGWSCRLPQPVQLTIGEELLGYHNNNNNKVAPFWTQ